MKASGLRDIDVGGLFGPSEAAEAAGAKMSSEQDRRSSSKGYKWSTTGRDKGEDDKRIMGALGAAVLLIIMASVGLYASSRSLSETAHRDDNQHEMCPLNKKGTRAAMVLLAASGFLLMFSIHSLLPYDWSNSVWRKGKAKAKGFAKGALAYKPMLYLITFGIVFLTFGMLLDKNIEEDQCGSGNETLEDAQKRNKHFLVVPGGVAVGAGFFILGLSAYHNRKRSGKNM